MQRFLAFIPRKWRLAPWQVLLGAAATVAWWGFLTYIPLVESLPNHILIAASWPLPAWLVYWLFVIAFRETAKWASTSHPKAVRALTEVAAFTAMVGLAALVTYLFPEKHFWHGEVSDVPAYSPLVFAAVLACQVALYIAHRILAALSVRAPDQGSVATSIPQRTELAPTPLHNEGKVELYALADRLDNPNQPPRMAGKVALAAVACAAAASVVATSFSWQSIPAATVPLVNRALNNPPCMFPVSVEGLAAASLDNLPLLDGPDGNGEDKLHEYDEACALGRSGHWLRVRYERNGVLYEGWVNDTYVRDTIGGAFLAALKNSCWFIGRVMNGPLPVSPTPAVRRSVIPLGDEQELAADDEVCVTEHIGHGLHVEYGRNGNRYAGWVYDGDIAVVDNPETR